MAGVRKSARVRKSATRKTAGKNANPARAGRPRSARPKSAASKTSPKRWSQRVTRESDALSAARRVQADKSREDRGFAQALRGMQFTSQGWRLSLRALDADILYQPRWQDVAENPTRPPAARQDRAEAPLSSRVILSVVPANAGTQRRELAFGHQGECHCKQLTPAVIGPG